MDLCISSAPRIGSLGTVELPWSKSMATRALVLAARRGLELPRWEGGDPCRDAELVRRGLQVSRGRVDVEMSAAALRFLTAYHAASAGHDVTLDGAPRLRERPIGPLVEALRSLGAQVDYLGREGSAPLRVVGRSLRGSVEVDCGESSQYASALMLVGLDVRAVGRVVSRPYLELTRAMCRGNVPMERDWSAALPWLSLRALGYGVELPGLNPKSLQADRAALELFGSLAVSDGVALTCDVSQTPDLAMSLAATACALGRPLVMHGVRNLRLKESDRIDALIAAMHLLGHELTLEGGDTVAYDGNASEVRSLDIDSRGDHRLCMAVAPLAALHPGLRVHGAECVDKSYPAFWRQLGQAGFKIEKT